MKKEIVKKILLILCILILIIFVIIFGINAYVKFSTKSQIMENDFSNIENVDCILVLGAKISDDKPSFMLEDRLEKAISLYQMGVSSKIIMSGDHHREDYDEVNVMKNYAIERNVLSNDIFMDHAGFSTYDSIYRAKAIFQAKKIIIVTQKYHLYRALYIANKLGLDAIGVPAEEKEYAGATYRELREILARDKDFVKSIFKPKPTYLGDVIPITSDGNLTND